MFSCPNGVPVNDPVANTYSCGSEVLNFSLYFSFSFTFLIVVVGTIFYIRQSGNVRNLSKWYKQSKCEDNRSICLMSSILEEFRKFVLLITLYTIFILLPSYSIMSTKGKTFTEQYGWVVGGFFIKVSM